MTTKGVAVTASTGSALAVGGAGTYYYLSKSSGGLTEEEIQLKKREKLNEEVEAIKSYLKFNKDLYLSVFQWKSYESNDAWKKFEERGICSATLFPNLTVFTKGTDANNVSLFSEESNERADGCVSINWQQTKENGKWKGSVRVEWVLRKGNQALISLASFKNSDAGNTIDIYIKAHSLNLEGETWSIKNTKEHTENARTDKFIKDANNAYWGFNLDLANGCGWNKKNGNGCNFSLGDQHKTTTTTKIYQWWEDKETSSDKKFSSWSKNFTTWWNSYLKAAFNLNEKEQLTGIWREIV